MPEGHTLHRLARSVHDAFGGRLVQAGSPQGRFADGAALLDGQRVARSDAVGKHLLVGFLPPGAPERRTPEHWLHVHLGLYGKVAFGTGEPPPPVGAVRLRLVTLDGHADVDGQGDDGQDDDGVRWADLRGPTACEVLLRPEVDALRARLGPDPLRRDDGPERFLARAGGSRVTIGALLMHQDVLAGAGNIYRAEALYRAGLDPAVPGRDVDPERLLGIWDDLTVLMRAGVRSGRIVTTRPADRRRGLVQASGDEADGSPVRRGQSGAHYVYRRQGLPCRLCGTTVATSVVEGRNLFWCPQCQAPGVTTSPFAA